MIQFLKGLMELPCREQSRVGRAGRPVEVIASILEKGAGGPPQAVAEDTEMLRMLEGHADRISR